jgi:mRNA interferase HigB
VKVISLKRIREARKARSDWGVSLQACYQVTKKAKWCSFLEVTQTFHRADSLAGRVAFNVGGTKCRLISYIRFGANKLYILHILRHAEYDEEGWKDDCD